MSDLLERLRAALADRYAIESEIGRGGMATVYLAKDLKHERRVAVKVLKPELAAVLGAERFLAEIKVTANLQHPHILPLHDSGQAGGFLFYVMPYVEGESLRAKLDREKQLSVDEAVGIAGSVANALDYAHRHGVIHRDIKPANILLQDGQAMVADFGIALAVRAAGGSRLTETGLSLGTPQYISPEQAAGDREVDGRADIYSLGCVLYEMLVGEPPHTGPTVQAIIAKLLTDAPRPVSELRETVPAHVAASLDGALAKLPADRFGRASDFGEALTNQSFTSLDTRAGATAGTTVRGPWRLAAVSMSMVAAVLAMALLWVLLRPKAPDSGSRSLVTRMSIQGPQHSSLLFPGDNSFAVSPDGQTVVFRFPRADGSSELRIRRLDSFESDVLRGTEGATKPFFSPDGKWIGFHSDGAIRKVSLSGGAPQLIAPSPRVYTIRWRENDSIYFTLYAPASLRLQWQVRYGVSMWTMGANGGDPIPLKTEMLKPGAQEHNLFPQPLPGGRGLIYTGLVGRDFNVMVRDFRTGETRILVPSATAARYLPSGHLMYGYKGDLFVRPFDVEGLDFEGPANLVVGGVAQVQWRMWYDVSAEGTLVFFPGGVLERATAWVWYEPGADGGPTEIPYTRGATNAASISPGGRRLVYTKYDGANHYVFVRDLVSGIERRLSLPDKDAWGPLWLADGERVVYGQVLETGTTLYWAYADGRSPPERLMESRSGHVAAHVMASGKIMFQENGPDNPRDIWELDPITRETRLLVGGPADQTHGIASPDDRWIAYASDESGRWEVYVRETTPPATAIQVSTNGGIAPLWSSDGERLFYLSVTADSVWMVEPNIGEPDSSSTTPSLVLNGDFLQAGTHQRGYGLTEDGRFIMRMPVEDYPAIHELRVVQGWDSDLRR